jgi:hypothetical protein
MGIGVSNRLEPTNIFNNRFVTINNYKEHFFGFFPK